jgi:diguanylate cyclase (GGDEF)-like protein
MHLLRRLTSSVRRPTLVLRFAVISIVLVAALGAVAMNWLSGYIRDSNVSGARETANYSVELTIRQLGIKKGRVSPITAPEYKLATSLLESMVATKRYVGAVVWSPEGHIVYAAEAGRLGRAEATRKQLQTAVGGAFVAVVVRAPRAGLPDATERRALTITGPLLESFAPIKVDGRVIAVVELYQAWEPVERTIARQTRIVVWSILAGLAVLWLGLFSLVLSASRRTREQAAANLALALTDPLTGLANRSKLREQVDSALATQSWSGCGTGLMLLDLDRFKEVNDTLGHHYGDALLKQIGPRLAVALREGDSIARLGGDEFVVVLADISGVPEAVAIAERMKLALTEPFEVDTIFLDVQASIGITVSPEHGNGFDTLLQRADIAMYTAKASRSYIAVYDEAADARSPGQLARISQLRRAVSNSAELELHYQPKASLGTGEVRGVEALVRWRHPTDGLLSPAEFIPLAERTGLIVPLTYLVLREALGRLRDWNRAGLDLSMAINISPRSLEDASFPALISGLLGEYNVDPSKVELEITENAVMEDPDQAIALLSELAALGVVLSVDDFGTGHSSMAYLQRLPVHQLKIDQSFVGDMTANPTAAVIVRSCIDLAQNLGLTTVAEGVEDQATWEHLTRLGCELAQGYHLGRPMPAHVFLAWLAERQKDQLARLRGLPDGAGRAKVAP